jgi:hypothetical protein
MFDKAPISRFDGFEGYAMPSRDTGGETGGVRRVIADVAELAELQARLLASDAKCLTRSIYRPVVMGAISVTVLLGTLPILLLACAGFLVENWQWSVVSARLIVAGIAIFIAGILGASAMRAMRACGPPLRNSAGEFEKNMDTLREMLSGKSVVQSQLERMERREDRN